MSPSFQHARDIIEVGRRLYEKGFVASHDGNISIRVSPGQVLTTTTGVSKGFLSREDIVVVDMQGKRIGGRGQPSSELKMHLLVYEKRGDVAAVVHAHPPVSTGFAVAGIPLAQCILPEVVISLGAVPVAAYGTPSTYEVCDAIAGHVQKAEAFLLANHGVVTLGQSVFQAYYRMETVEHFARILLTARLLGNVNVLSREQVEKLVEVRKSMGIEGKFPSCESCGYCDDYSGKGFGAAREVVSGISARGDSAGSRTSSRAAASQSASRETRLKSSSAPRARTRSSPGPRSLPEDQELIDLIRSVIKEITQEG